MVQSTVRLDLRQLRIQAKELVRAVRAADPSALSRVAPYIHPSPKFTLANAQLVVARENGFESWPRLQRQLDSESAGPLKSGIARLFEAIESGDEAAVLEMLQESPELAGVWRKKRYGWVTPLFVAASLGRLASVKALVEAGADIYAVNQGGYPPVFEAIHAGHWEIADHLLEASAKSDLGGLPPTFGCGIDIVLAARLGLLDRVQMHVERDPLAVYRRGCIGESVLHWPAHNGYVEVVAYLLDHGAFIGADEIGLYGGKPLHWAAEHAPACVKLLLERGADPNARNLMSNEFEGYTPLHMMARQADECIDCARLLLAAGADPSLTDRAGRTALGVALKHGRERTAEFLKKWAG